MLRVLLCQLFKHLRCIQKILRIIVGLRHQEANSGGVIGLGLAFKLQQPRVRTGHAAVIAFQLQPALHHRQPRLSLLLGISWQGQRLFQHQCRLPPPLQAQIGEAKSHAYPKIKIGAGGERLVFTLNAGQHIALGKDQRLTSWPRGKHGQLLLDAVYPVRLMLEQALR